MRVVVGNGRWWRADWLHLGKMKWWRLWWREETLKKLHASLPLCTVLLAISLISWLLIFSSDWPKWPNFDLPQYTVKYSRKHSMETCKVERFGRDGVLALRCCISYSLTTLMPSPDICTTFVACQANYSTWMEVMNDDIFCNQCNLDFWERFGRLWR